MDEASRRCPFTLKTVDSNYPVPLKSIDVHVTISGFTANVVSTLRYKNTETNPIEAVYEFPIDDQSAVYRFEAQIEDRLIIAECQEKQQAKETYEDAIRTGHTATYLEEDDASSDIFRCLVGNLPPAADAVITFAYVIELPLTPEGAVQFVLPTQLNPRYNPSSEDGGAKSPTAAAYVGSQPYAFTFQASVFNAGKISSVKSGSSKDELSVTLSEDGVRAEVKLVNKFVADHDMVLQVYYEDPFQPHLLTEKGNKEREGILRQDVLMLNFFPQLTDSEFSSKHEFVFVIDRSGSMRGDRITSAKKALLVFLKSLPPGCFFNIIGFGSRHYMLFQDGSREYSEDSLKAGCDYQNALDANFGGTEILQPLRAIYSKPCMSTHSRQIMLLTDGDVTNASAVIDLVRKNADNTRVFSFGIGEGASTSLVKGVARAGRGTAEFVRDNDRITELVTKTLKAAMQASVTDLHLEWQLGGSAKLVQVPREMPPLFSGNRLIVYAINTGDQTVLDGQVHLKGKVGERAIEFRLDINQSNDTGNVDTSLPIHRLAAKAEIKQLQDSEGETGEKSKAEIILLSVASNIVSRHTSMVGVDKDSKNTVAGDLVQRHVPLVRPVSGLRKYKCASGPVVGDVGMGSPRGAPVEMSFCQVAGSSRSKKSSEKKERNRALLAMDRVLCSKPRAAPPPRSWDTSAAALDMVEDCMAENCVDFNLAYDLSDEAPAGRAHGKGSKGSAETTDYLSVISLQTFDGCWKLDDQLAALISLTLQQLKDCSPVKSLDVWATVLALALLSVKFGDKRTEWEMIELKSKQWLTGQRLEGHSVDRLLELATDIITDSKK